MPARIRTLDRKLLRDLWAMKGQEAARAMQLLAFLDALTQNAS